MVQMYSVLLYQVVHIIIFHLFKVFDSLWSRFVRLVVALETVIDMIIDICIPFELTDHTCTLHIWLEKFCHLIVLSWLNLYTC